MTIPSRLPINQSSAPSFAAGVRTDRFQAGTSRNPSLTGQPPVDTVDLRFGASTGKRYKLSDDLCEALIGRDYRAARKALGQGAFNNYQMPDRYTDGKLLSVLEYAFWKNDPEMAAFLMMHGAKMDENIGLISTDYDFFHETLQMPNLHWLIKNWQTDMLDLILNRVGFMADEINFDIDRVGAWSDTAVMTAVQENNLDALEKLLALDPDLSIRPTPDWPVDNTEAPVLVQAAKLNNIKALALLLPHIRDEDVHATDNTGQSALDYAQASGNASIAELILARGGSAAVVDNTDAKGRTRLMRSVIEGHGDLAAALIKHNADINRQNAKAENHTALHYAVTGQKPELVKLLLDSGRARPDIKDADGWTPLRHAVERDLLDVARMLVTHGADLNEPDDNGISPLVAAIEDGRVSFLELLDPAGNAADNDVESLD